MTVTAAGFSTYEADSLVLSVGQNLALHIAMTVGSSVTQVEVSTTAAMVEDTKSDVSTAVDSRAIQDLPINGRCVDSFVLLTPSVTNDATFGLLTFRGVAGNNSFLIDGNDNTEQFYDEFQVVSTDYSAEYGRAMGGAVNRVLVHTCFGKACASISIPQPFPNPTPPHSGFNRSTVRNLTAIGLYSALSGKELGVVCTVFWIALSGILYCEVSLCV